MFYPADTTLGTVTENETFSFEIYYEEEALVGVTTTVTRYPVNITFDQVNPATVTKLDGDPASISGFYFDAFDSTLQYRTPQNTFAIVNKFEEIDRNNLSQMIYYLADKRRTITYTYTANAIDDDNIIATTTYSIVVQNDWTIGKNNLQTYVGFTR